MQKCVKKVKRLLVVAKRSAYDMYVLQHGDTQFKTLLQSDHSMVKNLVDRHRAHNETIKKCTSLFDMLKLDWTFRSRDRIHEPINGYDLVITIGGDGTVLDTAHFLDGETPLLGINSDPTDSSEVNEKFPDFDATRSRGYLCAATAFSAKHVLASILNLDLSPLSLTRISTSINGQLALSPGLNDVLVAHPSPACVSRFSLRTANEGNQVVHVRSSGLRICTAAGSSAAMKSAGGHPMDILSNKLQYKVREPLEPHVRSLPLLHNFVEEGQTLALVWGNREGKAFVDGAHLSMDLKLGDVVEFGRNAPPLLLYHKKVDD